MKFRIVPVLILSLFVSNAFAYETSEHPFMNSDVTKTIKNVVVVGGGMSGLAAAITAINNGCNVTLLESQSSVGGKLYSEELGGIQTNLGAQYILNNLHPIIDYYAGIIRAKNISDLKTGYVKNGVYQKLMMPEILVIMAAMAMLDADRAAATGNKEFYFDKDPQNQLWNDLEAMATDYYFNTYRTEIDPSAAEFIMENLKGEAGGNISELSAIIPTGWYGNLEQDVKFLLEGGNEVLAESIKDDFVAKGGNVILNKTVTNVAVNGTIVNITCQDSTTYTADYAVVATPAYIVKNIVSGLSIDKIAALDNVDYAKIAIVSLYIKNFTPGNSLHGVLFMDDVINGVISQTGSPVNIGLSDKYLLQPTDVVSIIVTDETLYNMTEEDLVAAVANKLPIIVPTFDPSNDVIDYLIKKYDNGIVKCSPSFLSTNQDQLKASVSDKIFFAGDYMYSPDLAGAAWAGERAAQAILAQ